VKTRTEYLRLSKYKWSHYVEHAPLRESLRDNEDPSVALGFREFKKRARLSNRGVARDLEGEM
jgi:hypothetical protein